MPGVSTLETPACPSCLAPMVWSPVGRSWACPSCWNKTEGAGPDPERELPPGAVAGDVIRNTKTGQRFRLVPLPDPAAPGEPLTPTDELRGQVERLRGELRTAQGEARDNARAWIELEKRVKALEGGKGDAES
jgi:hypothetical protein